MTSRDYRFTRRPRWIAGHIIALVAIIVFVNMGLWQIRRLHEKQAFNKIVTSRTTQTAQSIDDLLAEYGQDQDALELRSVVAKGVYNVADEVILRSRSYNGLSGHHVLTPLELGDGRAIIVDRGWVPIDLDSPGRTEFLPPDGPVEVRGVLRKTEVRGSFGPVDPAEGLLSQISRVDIARLDQQTESELVPVYIELTAQEPPQSGELPVIVPLPQPSEGPHRGYAVQWFLFTGVVVVGYPILLRRTAETEAEASGHTGAEPSG
ncbi:MAG: SURF1 family protein [Acidimicrobiia bacterium]|jgi:surfeit locus 1 family protein